MKTGPVERRSCGVGAGQNGRPSASSGPGWPDGQLLPDVLPLDALCADVVAPISS
jgi:hypothetical protein